MSCVAGAPHQAHDFGAGGVSFTDLRTLEVDTLKIAPTFVHNMMQRNDDAAMVQAMITMAKGLDCASPESIADPLHPSLLGTRGSEGSAAAIATAGSTIFTLGTRAFSYTTSLTKIGEELATTAVSAATDLAIDEGCALMTGRSGAAELYRYDDVYRLTEARYADGVSETFSYDPAGNRKSMTTGRSSMRWRPSTAR